MQLVERAPFAPGECLIRHSGTGPLIDLQAEFDWRHNGRMYISREAVRQMAELCGFVPAERLSELGEIRAELEQAKQELEKHEGFRKQVQSAGLVIRRPPGRPKKKEAATNGS